MPWNPKTPGSTVQQDTDLPVSREVVDKPLVVGGSQAKYRREFYNTAPSDWVLTVDSSMALGQTGSALTLGMGTTANKTSTFTCSRSFGPPFTAGFSFKLSQKIANNAVYLDMVAENADGTLDETCIGSIRLDGSASTTNTVFQTEVQNGGPSKIVSGQLTGSAPQTADVMFEIVFEVDEMWIHSKVPDSNAGRTTSYPKNLVAPDPARRYRPRLRFVNGGTAPASSTVVTFYALTVSDFTEHQVSILGGSGSSNPGQAVPVSVTNAPSVSINNTPSVAPSASATATGTGIAKINSAATTNATSVKSSNTRVYGYQLTNTGASTAFVRLYNKASAPTVGTDSPAVIIAIPAGQTIDADLTVPLALGTGFGYSITGAALDLDATAVAANQVVGYILWI